MEKAAREKTAKDMHQDSGFLGWFAQSPATASPANSNTKQTPTPSSAVSSETNAMSVFGESLAISLFGGSSAGIGVAVKKMDGAGISITGVAPRGPADGKLQKASYPIASQCSSSVLPRCCQPCSYECARTQLQLY